jgi:hypothetical protein
MIERHSDSMRQMRVLNYFVRRYIDRKVNREMSYQEILIDNISQLRAIELGKVKKNKGKNKRDEQNAEKLKDLSMQVTIISALIIKLTYSVYRV